MKKKRKEDSEKVSTKQCWKCGNKNLLKLYSLRKKCCTDCNTVIQWDLQEQQKSLL